MSSEQQAGVAERYLGLGRAGDRFPLSGLQLAVLTIFEVTCVVAIIVVDAWWAKGVLLAALAAGSAIVVVSAARRRPDRP